MFLSCENYLSFWEPHYQLAWLPLFPKRLASIYLGLRGRSSEFLLSSITYTTRPGVNRILRAIGFRFNREMHLRRKLDVLLGPGSKSGRAGSGRFRTLAMSIAARLTFEWENLRRMFASYVAIIVQKPALIDALEAAEPTGSRR
jgi:hypothetical protein